MKTQNQLLKYRIANVYCGFLKKSLRLFNKNLPSTKTKVIHQVFVAKLARPSFPMAFWAAGAISALPSLMPDRLGLGEPA